MVYCFFTNIRIDLFNPPSGNVDCTAILFIIHISVNISTHQSPDKQVPHTDLLVIGGVTDLMDRQSEIKASIQSMEPGEFEMFVASVWTGMGWTTDITQNSRDQGVDIIAKKSGVYTEKAVIQAKCYSSGNKVGRPDIQQYSTLKKQIPDADTVIVVTSGDFTTEAVSLSEQLNVKTVCGDELVQISKKYLSREQLNNFLRNTEVDSLIESNFGSDIGDKSVPTDNLTQSEQDLTKIYKGYFQRYVEDAKEQNEQGRRLIFQVNNIDELVRKKYIVRGQVHYVDFYPENNTLIKRLEKTIKKYGWRIKNERVKRIERAGFDVNKIKDVDDDFSMVIDTGAGSGSADPKRQAKITSLLFSSIFNEDLSGTRVKEATGYYTNSSPTTVIE